VWSRANATYRKLIMGSCGAGLMTQKGLSAAGMAVIELAALVSSCAVPQVLGARAATAPASMIVVPVSLGVVIGLVSAVDEDRDLLGGVAEIRWLHAPLFRGTGTC
jgi:hypothetical protein